MNKKFYITTAIDYVNGLPHVGHALEKVQADVLARYHRLLGEEVFYLTGVDENSLKNVQAAEKEGISVKELVDKNTEVFYNLKDLLNLSFDKFVRTTEDYHFKGAQKLWQAVKKSDIYKKKYAGLYCVGCELFLTEKELENGLCPEHQTKPELVEEENYFFKLSDYQEKLYQLIESDKLKVSPERYKKEILGFIKQGLEDFSISRSKERAKGWGVPVPGDPEQVMYVWFDALANYITALDYAEEGKLYQDFWVDNNNILHVIGKGILRFHAVYWPAMLLSAGLKLPKEIFVHSYFTVNNQKISKSLGNVIGPEELVKKYGVSATRYLLLSFLPQSDDGDISWEKLDEKYNAELANGLGNLTARVLAMVDKKLKGEAPAITKDWPEVKALSDKYIFLLGNKAFEPALRVIAEIIALLDGEIEKNKLYKQEPEQAAGLLYQLLESIRQLAWLLLSVMPETANKIFSQLGLDPVEEKRQSFKEALKWGGLPAGTKVQKGEPLFPRL
ncbi:MAG: methionine--tRNA ligase [bacterium]